MQLKFENLLTEKEIERYRHVDKIRDEKLRLEGVELPRCMVRLEQRIKIAAVYYNIEVMLICRLQNIV